MPLAFATARMTSSSIPSASLTDIAYESLAAAAQTAYVLSADGGSLNKAEMMLLKYSRSAAS